MLFAALAAPAGAQRPSEGADAQLHGVQVHPLWDEPQYEADGTPELDPKGRPVTWSERNMVRELDLAAAAGVDVVRADLGWSTLEAAGPEAPFTEWYAERVDRFLAAASARGVEVILTLTDSPCWASSAPESVKAGCSGAWWERGVQRYAPTDPTAYANAAVEVAQRWGAQVTALELWNEPNESSYFETPEDTPEARASRYAALVKASYHQVKLARPELTVLAGALATGSGRDSYPAFLSSLYRLGIKGHYDAISYHPYSDARDPDAPLPAGVEPSHHLTAGTAALREVMAGHGDIRTNLWITEFGFPSCEPAEGTFCVGEAAQGGHTLSNHRIAASLPFVRATITYEIRDRGSSDDPYGQGTWGLLREDFTEKPAWSSLRSAMERYGETR
jgi:hypothetical protein